MQRALKIAIPLLIVGGGALIAWVMVLSREQPAMRTPEVSVPLIQVLTVERKDIRLSVHSQGTVSPRTESPLVPEVSGRILEVGLAFESGGFFEEGELLVRIDPFDYRQALIEARQGVKRAELSLVQERAEAEIARREWAELEGGEAPPLTAREPQIAQAEATLAAAEAAIERAERNLERTQVRAPYAGRVRNKSVDVGQYVTPGTPLATIYAVDWAEVRLPIRDAELAFLDLPLVYRGGKQDTRGPQVVLRATFAGGLHEWNARVVRTEGEIDQKSRMVHVVARVKNPYGRERAAPGRPPLAAGLYVQAEILGKKVTDVVVLPRAALRGGGRVLVVDDDDRLRFREVEIMRQTGDEVIVTSGLVAGERIALSNLAAVTDGMRVRAAPAEDPS